MQTKVDISKDSIYVNGNRISKKLPPKLYFAVNKPKGLVSYLPYWLMFCISHDGPWYLAFKWNIYKIKGTISFMNVVSICYRYICSSGEESKSVVSLFNDYLKGWVCNISHKSAWHNIHILLILLDSQSLMNCRTFSDYESSIDLPTSNIPLRIYRTRFNQGCQNHACLLWVVLMLPQLVW